MSRTTTGWNDTVFGAAGNPCGICSNGPVQVYHYGGPCPYRVQTVNYCPHCGKQIAAVVEDKP